MFGNTKQEKQKAGGVIPATSSSSSNSLVQGTSVEGTITADMDIRIDGTLRGSLQCKGKVIIGPTGYIVGDISCENAVIEGRFEGDLVVSDVLHIKETAKVEGEVSTQKLVVQPGSIFNVKCRMGAQSGNGTPRKVSLDDEEATTYKAGSASKATVS